MPTMEEKSNDTESPRLLREFFYGPPKTKKTWLAGTAAEAGFNTILLDTDHGYHILLKQLSPAAKKRLQLIECRDTTKSAIACEFMTRFLFSGKVFFNEETRKIVYSPTKLDDNCIELNLSTHFDKNTVLILDSYTALVESLKMRYAIENKLDLDDPTKENREGYAWYGTLASTILNKLTKLPCHVIVIGHETVYEKYEKSKTTGKQELVSSRRQIKSTSNPHSMTIGDKFSDILYFHNVSSALTKVESRAEKDAEGGSRLIPPNSYKWDDLKFAKICEYAGIPLPPKDLPYLNFKPEINKGGLQDAGLVKKEINSKPGLTQIKGLKPKS